MIFIYLTTTSLRYIRITFLICALLIASAARQYAQRADSICEFHVCQLLVPSALIGIGAYGVNNGWMKSVKTGMDEAIQTWSYGCKIDNYLQYAPTAIQLGLGAVGAPARHEFLDRLAATATAWAAMGIMVNGLKYTVREPRPDTGERNSFPSGHTATAFTGAELVRLEYGNWWGLGAYSIASLVGLMRMYNRRHWTNDVLAGAGIGILSARIGYWLMPLERRWLGWGTTENNTSMTLMPSQVNGHPTLALNLCF